MEERRQKILKGLKEYLLIAFGLLVYVMGWVIFLIPNNLVGGGVSGIGAVVYYATGIPVSVTFFVVNFVLLAIALKVLGPSFGIKTVYAVIITTLMFQFLPQVIPSDIIELIGMSNGKLLATIIGGVMSGFGIGLAISQGGSTAGTDIIALMVAKYRNISTGKMILSIDVFIVLSSLIIPMEDSAGNMLTWGEKIAVVTYGFVLIACCSYTIDLYLSGSKQSVQIFIFSKKYPEIADRIASEMHRGVSVLDAEGWYTKADSKVLMVIARKAELNTILRMIKGIDPEAFLSAGTVMGVYGKGFDKIKVKAKQNEA
ncbi:MAG: YitT family protein [Bacteroidetes bacterium]|uniref:YitT family protein n=1 Tax=Candidatus Merdivivens pullicola TaxID=2840872 RepID=A0A9D9NHL2_9BACT|nr:YitT family protein [Candidatus Merdivivens pullicola]